MVHKSGLCRYLLRLLSAQWLRHFSKINLKRRPCLGSTRKNSRCQRLEKISFFHVEYPILLQIINGLSLTRPVLSMTVQSCCYVGLSSLLPSVDTCEVASAVLRFCHFCHQLFSGSSNLHMILVLVDGTCLLASGTEKMKMRPFS